MEGLPIIIREVECWFGDSQALAGNASFSAVNNSLDAFGRRPLMLHPARYDAHFVVHVGICDRIRTKPKIKMQNVWMYTG